MIEVCNLYKSFGDHSLFEDFNLKVNKGDFVILSGVSGCGKTTLLNMIGGLLKPDSGQILIQGTDITKEKNLIRFYSDTVGFLFQNFALVENKTVEANLNMIKKSNKENVTMEDALKRVGMQNQEKKKVYTLSGGEQQRVCLARLMLKRCDLILADEPTGSLDSQNAKTVMDILHQMNDEGKTIILVTHDEEIKKQGKRVIEL